MKKWLLFFIIGFVHTQIWAQAPLGFNYQGIARQADGTPISGQTIGVKISIIDGPQGSSQFVEEHFLQTNEFGLFTAVVGQGNGNNTLNSVDWSLGNLWLQIELDPENSGSYILMGSQQLMSVPYALFAQQSGEGLSPGYGISVNEGTISNVLPDRPISITGSGNVQVTGEYPNFNIESNGSADADADPTNELQDLQLKDDILTITNNGIATDINLTPYLDNTDTQLSEADVDGFADNNGYLKTELDGDVTNEIQDLQLVGNTLTITDNGTASEIDLTPYLDNTDTQLTEAEVDVFANNNGYLTAEVDGSVSNEIQDLQLVGQTLTITNNGTATDIDLTPFLDNTDTQLTEAEVDGFADNNGYLKTEADGDVTNELQTLTEVLIEGANAGDVKITNLANPVASQDAATKNYVDTQDGAIQALVTSNTSDISTNVTDIVTNAATITANSSAITSNTSIISTNTVAIGTNTGNISTNTTAISTETTAREAADIGLQSEVDASQTGAGLGSTGAYVQDGTTTYISGATSLQNADKLLDTAVDINATDISTNSSSIVDEIANRTNADGTIQSELDASQTGAGLGSTGAYVQDGTTTYISGATSLQNANKLLDMAVDINATDISTNSSSIVDEITNRTNTDGTIQAELDASQTGAGLGTTGAYVQDGTTTYISGATSLKNSDKLLDTAVDINATDISTNSSSIADEIINRTNADGTIQAELDASQTGSGLGANGSYMQDGTTTYISGATSLQNADKLLDTAVDINATGISTNSSSIADEITNRTNADGTIQAELDASQTGAGLGSTGAYVQDGTTTYISGATSLQNADKLLDTKVDANSIDIASNSADIGTLTTTVGTTYAFNVPITESTSVDISFDLSVFSFAEDGIISGSNILIAEPGVYKFTVKGTSSLGSPSTIFISAGGVDSQVYLDGFDYYNDEFLFKLNAGNVVELKVVSGGFSETFNLEFFGYKL